MSRESARKLPQGPLFAMEEWYCSNRKRQPTHHGPRRPWPSEQRNSLRCPVRRQEIFHRDGNFGNVCLYSKMPSVQELDSRVRNVLAKCLGARGNEKRIVLTPN